MTPRSELEFIARQVVAQLRNDPNLEQRDGVWFVSAEGAARRLGLSLRLMRDLLARGVIPSYKFEKARRVAIADLEAYAAACKEDRAA